jgi:opacity protein-like surface antigen
MLLAPAIVVFVGIAGKHPEKIEHQLQPVLAHAHVAKHAVSAGDLGNLARHSDTSRDIVQQMHVDGVVGGALIESGGTLTLRVVIYDGDGNLTSLGETPLDGRAMSKDELEVLGENLDDELGGLAAKHKAAPSPAIAEPELAMPKPTAKPTPMVAVAPPKKASASDEISFDSDAPATPASEEHHDAAPKETSDAVSLDDVAALNNGGATDDSATTTATPTSGSGLHLHANAGLGVVSRSFSGPTAMMGYSSSAVGAAHVEAGLAPVDHLALDVMAEEALGMSTQVGKTDASTSMSRWEITASYTFGHGAFQLSPSIGYGQRDFSIDSSSTDRSPDTSYGYMLIGAKAAYALGSRFSLRAIAAFEPVTGGADPTAMEFGASTRWAFDAGAGLEMHVWTHVVARAAFDYQQFSWSWAAAGTRAASSAVDSYPTGTLSVGAEY